MAAKDKVRVGVIGAGSMGALHCRSLAMSVAAAEMVWVADDNAERARQAAALAPGARATTDYRELLADPAVDAVVIATPNDTHAALIQEASAAGKHIFCEKPLALDLPDADAALAAVEERGVKLQIGFQRRFDAGFQKVHRAVESGELGEPELLLTTTRDPKPPSLQYMRRSGGLFTDTAIHDLDAVRYVTGREVVEVFCMASTLLLPEGAEEGFVDTAVTALRLETGALAVVTNSLRAAYGYEVGMEVLGPGGKVAVGQESRTGVRHYGAGGVSHEHVYWYHDRFREAYLAELAHFVECVAEDREPVVGGRDARAALALALLARRSARERRPVSVDEGV